MRPFWCLLFVLIRHGEEGATSLHAGLERLEKETGEPTGTFGSFPLRTLSSHGDNTFTVFFAGGRPAAKEFYLKNPTLRREPPKRHWALKKTYTQT